MDNNKKRIQYLDNCRAVCMLWIVGIWHLLEYCDITTVANSSAGIHITHAVLASFTFISGLFLGKSKVIMKSDLICFYKKRLLRFYPLFFLSSTSLFLIYIMFGYEYIGSFRQLLFTITGLAVFVGDSPKTVWYISMLIVFYFMTPIIILLNDRRKKIALTSIIYLVMVSLHYLYDCIDSRVLVYYPFYFIPIVFSDNIEKTMDNNHFYPRLIISACAFGLLICVSNKWNAEWYFSIIISFLLMEVLLCVSYLLSKLDYINKKLYVISYSSMVAYLFHRQWYGLLQFVFFRTDGFVPLWFAYTVMLPSLLFLSYFSQQAYDNCIFLFTKRKCS